MKLYLTVSNLKGGTLMIQITKILYEIMNKLARVKS